MSPELNDLAHEVVRVVQEIRDVHLEVKDNRRTRDPNTNELVKVPTKTQALRLATFHHMLYHFLEKYEELGA